MRYILLNDYKFVINNMKKIVVFLLIPFLFLFINKSLSGNEIVEIMFGLNVELDSFNPIEVILFLLNIFVYLYFVFNLFIKDIKYQLDNIFIRIKPNKWNNIKVLFVCLFIFLLKLLQYFISYFIFFVLNIDFNLKDILILFLIDYIYVLLTSFILLVTYVDFSLKKYLFIIIDVLLVVLLPINIITLFNFPLLIFVLVIYIIVRLNILFKYFNKKILERIGGI